MDENRYSLAGWVAITQAIIFPLAFIISIAQGLIGVAAFGYRGPTFGPSDLLFIAFTGMSVYTLLMLRNLLNERYNYHDVDTLILLAICWGVVFQISSLALRFWVVTIWPVSETALSIIYLVFFAVTMITAGIIDILIAVKLLQIRQKLNEMIRAFTYITLISGLAEVSFVLAPVALLLVPVSCVILGLIFFRKEEVEFV
ncbi:MAG: hypothetical protein JSV10_07055 [Candidatus Zixiibacteriota bacterium]|nr:MAG: hypothetical protein JSV10_07055 [candidate division Zixibacteria bacterium]